MTGPVIYLALGEQRIRAAIEYTADLISGGARVTLVRSNAKEWADETPAEGVTVVKGGDNPWRTVKELLPGAGLLVAGDPESMPVADAARQHFPELPIQLEPVTDPDRRPDPADLAVVTPWYPSPNDPYAGAFVQASVRSLADKAGRVSILHTEQWFYPPWRYAGAMIDITLRRGLQHIPGIAVLDTPEGELTRVASPQARRSDYSAWVDEQIDRLRAALPTGRIEAPLVHAHTGHFGGVIAAELARPDARLVVTEHATFLRKVFAQPVARQRYAAMLERADHVMCVSQKLRKQIAAEFPLQAYKLRVVANAVDFDRFVQRPAPPERPRRWLYAGRMVEHKNVLTLLDGFARVAADDPELTLTLVGDGPQTDDIKARIRKLELGDRVRLLPPITPEEMTPLLHEHDLLVHASRAETFGLTIVESVATGTPVLVAASDGPAETLKGLDGVAGKLFPVTEDPSVVAEAYRQLVRQWPSLDLAAARADLAARYGYAAIGAQVLSVYEEPAPVPEPALPVIEPVDRIVVIAVNPPNQPRLREFMDLARQRGYGVDLLVTDPREWAREAETGIAVHRIGPAPAERPATPAVPRSGSPVPAAVVRAVRSKAATLRRKATRRGSGLVKPHSMWRRAARLALPEMDMTRVRRVVVHGPLGETIGWRLARRYPDLTVTTALRLPEEPDLSEKQGS